MVKRQEAVRAERSAGVVNLDQLVRCWHGVFTIPAVVFRRQTTNQTPVCTDIFTPKFMLKDREGVMVCPTTTFLIITDTFFCIPRVLRLLTPLGRFGCKDREKLLEPRNILSESLLISKDFQIMVLSYWYFLCFEHLLGFILHEIESYLNTVSHDRGDEAYGGITKERRVIFGHFVHSRISGK